MELLCVLSWLFLISASGSTAEDVKTTCFARAAFVGKPSLLTCNFDVDVRTLITKTSFNVRRIDKGTFDYQRDTILDCSLEPTPDCSYIKEGYDFDHEVSDHLTVKISNITWDDAGTYQCQLVNVPGKIETCNLTVLEEPEPPESKTVDYKTPSPTTRQLTSETTTETPGSEEQSDVNPIYIVVPVVIVVLVVVAVVVAVVLIRKRRSDAKNTSREEQPEEKELEKPTEKGLDESEHISDGHYDQLAFEKEEAKLLNSPPVRYDYAKVNKKKKEEGDTPGEFKIEDDDQERQPLTKAEDVTSPDTTTPNDSGEQGTNTKTQQSNDDDTHENDEKKMKDGKAEEDSSEKNDDDETKESDKERQKGDETGDDPTAKPKIGGEGEHDTGKEN